MTKLSISTILLCILAIISLFILYTNSLKELEYEKQKNANLEDSLKTQNEALTKLQLDTQVFNDKQEILESEIRKNIRILYILATILVSLAIMPLIALKMK